jgi:shikimate dehydrogenase
VIAGTTRVCCVIGDPIAHSRSPQMHGAAYRALGLDRVYVALRVEPERLAVALEGLGALGVDGVNVTIPHKAAAAAWCDVLSAQARAAAAANTVVWRAGRSEGHLTDGEALVLELRQRAPHALAGPAVVLGAGGTARAAASALASAGVPDIAVLARRPQAAQALVEELAGRGVPRLSAPSALPSEAGVLVNTTPAGREGLWELPLAADALNVVDAVADYVYRPDARPTALAAAASARGLALVDGLDLLARQGALAFALMTGRAAPLEIMREAARA